MTRLRPPGRRSLGEGGGSGGHARCPVCGGTWPAPDRIALLGRVAVAEGGAVQLSRGHAEIVACLLAAPVAAADFAAMFAGGDQGVGHSVLSRLNARLKPLGWRVRLIDHSDGSEVYALTEILRNEQGRLNCRPARNFPE